MRWRPLTIDVDKRGDVCILKLHGELKLGEPTALLRTKSREVVAAGETKIVIDLLDVLWLDSSGIGEVYACYKRARERAGEIRLAVTGKPYSMFTFTQLDRVFQMFEDTATAVASFGQES